MLNARRRVARGTEIGQTDVARVGAAVVAWPIVPNVRLLPVDRVVLVEQFA